MVRNLNPNRGKRYLFSPRRPYHLWDLHCLLFSVSFRGVKLPGREVNHLDSSWNVMAHGDAREGKWRGNWRMEWVASTLHTTSEHGVSSITTADAHTSAANSRLNWCPRRFKWTRPFRWKKKSSFCACAITFQTQSTARHLPRGAEEVHETMSEYPVSVQDSNWALTATSREVY